MIENKIFAGGGLNQDVDDNFLKPNDWDYALNIRNTDRFEFSDGVISNVKGNTLVSYTLPVVGNNKCIGSYSNEQTGKYYSFIYNSSGYHTITEFDVNANTIVNVLQSKTNTGGVDILQFGEYDLINGVGMIGGNLLYWTDGVNPPRGIDINNRTNGTVKYIDMLLIGSGYTSIPSVSISAPTSGVTATGTALTNGGSLLTIPITSAGTYTVAPRVIISAPNIENGYNATAVAQLSGVAPSGIQITIRDPGIGYTSAPTITLVGGVFTVAAVLGTPTISTFSITGIKITNPGSGYTSNPGVSIAAPVSGTTATARASIDYYTNIDSIQLIRAQPISIPTVVYGSDIDYSINRLKKQLFQFRYQYVYNDNTKSAWSSISKLPLPNGEINPDTDTNQTQNNYINVNYYIGDNTVKSINIAARVHTNSVTTPTSDYFLISAQDREGIIKNSINGYYNYRFYNDGIYNAVDVLETDLAYDFVPLTSKTLDIVNGNVLVLGNNKEQYDNIANLNVNLAVEYIASSVTPGAGALNITIQDQYFPDTGYPFAGTLLFTGTPAVGDIVSVRVVGYVPGGSLTTTYTVGVGDTISTIIGYFITALNSYMLPNSLTSTISPTYNSMWTSLNFYGPGDSDYYTPGFTFDSVSIIHSGTTGVISSSSYKLYSQYQFGLVYYDNFGRSSYVQTNNNFKIKTLSYGAVESKLPKINWQINHSAPTWATSYQWVRTEQLTHKTFLYWKTLTPVNVTPTGSSISYYDLDINSLKLFNDEGNGSILNYSFNPGDRVIFHKDLNTSSTTPYISGYDVQIVSFDETSYKIRIVKDSTKPDLTSASGYLIEIYTPKQNLAATTDTFFYEFGESYPCIGGVHSKLTGSFLDGDVYYKARQANNYFTENVEDPNFSDYYISDYSSNGRTNIFAPQAKQLTLPTDIRFSDTYVPNTNINGLSRFYGEAFETYDRVNGSIQKLLVRDNYLMTFQELKTGYIPIQQSIIEDQGTGNNANVAISNKLLNKIRYFAGDYGVGLHPESVVRFAGTMYFADPNRGEVMKLNQGLQSVSKTGMDSYFTKKLSTVKNYTNAKILGSYDPRNDEYIITFKKQTTADSYDETVAFNEDVNKWTTFYSFIPDFGNYIFNQYITYQTGALYTHNTNPVYNSFYGSLKTSIVQLTYNASPSLIKSFIGVIQQGNEVWTPGDITTNTLQHSSLLSTDFEKKEGVWFSSLLRDDASTGGLIEGDDLKGNWIKLRLSIVNTVKVDLLSVDVRAIPSYQGIK